MEMPLGYEIEFHGPFRFIDIITLMANGRTIAGLVDY
jgi:hypothetical protein